MTDRVRPIDPFSARETLRSAFDDSDSAKHAVVLLKDEHGAVSIYASRDCKISDLGHFIVELQGLTMEMVRNRDDS